ncbi:MAG: DUF2235 domain-containing protein [Synechococcales cyanobacterium RM1_1_8]|nr:DUF2235 domain-containing protein [Synechococcales cyanobacterium RM1_1_8]
MSLSASLAAPLELNGQRASRIHKRLVICCDGTWNEPSNAPRSQAGSQAPTHVFRLAQAIPAEDAQGMPQVVRYGRGLGTGEGLDRLLGGAIAAGIDQEIQDAYLFLSMNYQAGDEIYLFGFSRGAYTVRSLAGLIYTAGLLQPQEIRQEPGVMQIDRIDLANRLEEAYQLYRSEGVKPSGAQAQRFRADTANFGQVPIRLLCCWDTVGSLGIPDLWPGLPLGEAWNRRYRFHDHKLCSKIEYALHAVALDEARFSFDVTPMEATTGHLEQVLFPGDHGCVGGGTAATRLLANGSLQWVLDRLEAIPALGLEVDMTRLGEALDGAGRLPTDPLLEIVNPQSLGMWLLWRSLGMFSKGFQRRIPALSEGAIAWLAEQLGQDPLLLQQRQSQAQSSGLAQSSQAQPSRARNATYDLHPSTQYRLLHRQDYWPVPLATYLGEVLGLEGDRGVKGGGDRLRQLATQLVTR